MPIFGGHNEYFELIDIFEALPELESGTVTLLDYVNYRAYQNIAQGSIQLTPSDSDIRFILRQQSDKACQRPEDGTCSIAGETADVCRTAENRLDNIFRKLIP